MLSSISSLNIIKHFSLADVILISYLGGKYDLSKNIYYNNVKIYNLNQTIDYLYTHFISDLILETKIDYYI